MDPGISGLAINLFIVSSAEMIRRYSSRKRTKKHSFKDDETSRVYVEHDRVRIIYSDRPTWDFPHLARFGDKPLTYRMLQ
jgi:hypothetical protein